MLLFVDNWRMWRKFPGSWRVCGTCSDQSESQWSAFASTYHVHHRFLHLFCASCPCLSSSYEIISYSLKLIAWLGLRFSHLPKRFWRRWRYVQSRSCAGWRCICWWRGSGRRKTAVIMIEARCIWMAQRFIRQIEREKWFIGPGFQWPPHWEKYVEDIDWNIRVVVKL